MKKNLSSPKFLIPSLVLIVALGILIGQQTQSPISPIQTQFNINRKPISVNSTPSIIFPDTLAAFSRQEFVFSTDSPRSGRAVYVHGGELITFSIVQITDQNFQDAWNGNFLTVSCGDLQGLVKTYQQEKTPYRYATCQGIGFWYYEFRWFNNNWMLTASISSNSGIPDPKPLLEFVNSYPY